MALRLHAPATGRTVATVLAASAGNDMLHADFQWLCAGANTRGRLRRRRARSALSRSAA